MVSFAKRRMITMSNKNSQKKNFAALKVLSGFLFLFILQSKQVFSQNEKLTASTSATSIAVGEQFQVTFSVNASGRAFKAPTFTDFNVLMGPSQSNQMQIINGSVSQTLSFTYVLQAVKEGTFKIPPAEITVGSTKLTSNTLTITVAKASAQQQGQAQGQTSTTNKNGEKVMNGAGKDVYIKASIDKSSCYQGEGIAVVYRVYTKVNLLNFMVNKLPSFTGFWNQDLDKEIRLDGHSENIDGVSYRVADVKRFILFPQRSGTLTVDPMECEVIARVQVKRQKNQTNDPFSQFFNDPFFNNPFFNNSTQDVKIALKSDPIKITVKELPAGAPADFKGAVGKLSCEITLDKKETKANEAVNVKVKISGKGNIKLIDSPTLTFPPDFETYDPKENSNINASQSGVTGSKTFEYLVIPRNAGEFKIEAAPFVYFDLDKKQYVTIDFPEMNLKVNKGDGSTVTVSNSVQHTDVQLLGKDIRYIKTGEPNFEKDHEPLYGSPLFYSLTVAPAFAFLLLLMVRKRNEKNAGNSGLIKSQRANKEAMKRLSLAKKYLSTNEKEKFLDEMFKALWGFIGDKLQIPVSDLSKDKVSDILASRNLSPELINEFTSTIDSCEFARFAGGIADSNEKLYEKGIAIITKLENSIK